MFNFHNFVFQTIYGMIGIEPEYKVRQYALGWVEKNVLTQADLAAIDDRYEEIAAAITEEDDNENTTEQDE